MSGGTEAALSERELPELRSGLVVAGTYRVLSRLGVGGMAEVYEAEHVRLGSRAAVKFLHTNALSNPRAIERFRREARALAELKSDYIVTVFDCGELDDGTPYLVMERLVGEDLRSLLASAGALPVRRAVKLVIEACHGLAVVHGAGLVHRDLKPANLFVERREPGPERCKVLDFGVAKALASDTTRPGVMLGTLQYMAPEQLENSSSTRASADGYSLGTILYECLTGTAAHAGETVQELMFDILHRDPKPPSALRPVPPELDRITMRALSRDPAARFESVEELAEALAPFGAVSHVPHLRETADANTSSDALRTFPATSRRGRPIYSWPGVWFSAGALAGALATGWSLRGAEALAPAPSTKAQSVPRPERPAVASSPPASVEPSPTSAAAPPATESARVRAPGIQTVAREKLQQRTGTARPGASVDRRFDQENPYAE